MVFANNLGLIIFFKTIFQLDLSIKDYQKYLNLFFGAYQELILLVYSNYLRLTIFSKFIFQLDLFIRDYQKYLNLFFKGYQELI